LYNDNFKPFALNEVYKGRLHSYILLPLEKNEHFDYCFDTKQQEKWLLKIQASRGLKISGFSCPKCEKSIMRPVSKRPFNYRCTKNSCRYQFNLLKKTIFYNSTISISAWLCAYFFWVRSKTKSGSIEKGDWVKCIGPKQLLEKVNYALRKNGLSSERLTLFKAKKIIHSFETKQAEWLGFPQFEDYRTLFVAKSASDVQDSQIEFEQRKISI
jgi:hypothetical protein